MANRYVLKARISEGEFEALVQGFADEKSSRTIAGEIGRSEKTVKKFIQVLNNCLFSNDFREYTHGSCDAFLAEALDTGRSKLDAHKQCALYCPAIIRSEDNYRGSCRIECPAHMRGDRSPYFDPYQKILFIYRKFLASLDGYHLVARYQYFSLTYSFDDLSEDKKDSFIKDMLFFASRYPIDLIAFERSWSLFGYCYFRDLDDRPGLPPERPKVRMK